MTATASLPPATLPVRADAIPEELREGTQFLVWRWEQRDGKWTKPPRSAHTGGMASSTDPTTWTNFSTALAYASRHYAGKGGVGRVFAPDDPYSGVDLDKCRDPDTGEIEAWARAIVTALNSYTEVSPSGTGVKITVRGVLPTKGKRKGRIEMYREGRYFTMTGQHLAGTPDAPQERQEALVAAYHRELGEGAAHDNEGQSASLTPSQAGHEAGEGQRGRNEASDSELIQFATRSRNREKFIGLWTGSTAGYASQSEADIALCSLLAFYTGPDEARIDGLFRRSGLMRDKWDERRGEKTYGQKTVDQVLTGRTEYWTPGEKYEAYRSEHDAGGEVAPTPWVSPASAAYSDPLADEAFYGLVGEIVRAIEPHTESDPVALLLQLLVGVGNLIGRTPTLMMDGAAHHANLFAVLVGTTAKARKGTSWRQTRRVLAMTDPKWADKRITGGLSSGEGLIEAVADPASDDDPPPEPVDKRLMIQVGEFASVLAVQGREGNTLSAVLRDAWDGDTLTVLNRKANKLRATAPHISMVAHVTRDELLRMLQTTEAANGYANRFLWAAVRRPKLLPRGGNLTDEMLFPLVDQLKEAVRHARQTQYITLTEDAWTMWDRVYVDLSHEQAGLLGAITARAEPLILRLAMIYALMDNTGKIDVPHLTAGCAVWEYCQQSAAWIFGDKLGDPDGDLVLAHLRQTSEGVTRTEIHGLLGRNRSAAQVSRALAALEEKNLARRVTEVPDGDRRQRTERWYAITSEGT